MSSSIWLDDTGSSNEGHTLTGTLKFDGKKIWERSCHDNAIAIGKALEKIDPRFNMTFDKKEKTIEGHSKTISIKNKSGDTILDKLSTHDNMYDLVVSVSTLITINGL